MNGVVIQGRRVDYPVTVREAASASATWLVDAAAARALLPAPDLDVVEILPGYNEVSLALFVRERSAPRGLPYVSTMLDFLRGRVSTFIFWLPVDQAFTREAGETMWGFPKTIENIDFDHAGSTARCRLESEGRHVLTFSMPRRPGRDLPPNEMTTYTRMQGRTFATRFVSTSKGVGFARGGVELTLGDHAMSDKLRTLGLPKKPMMAMWMEHMHATFDEARPLA